jgi:hypothetical protein
VYVYGAGAQVQVGGNLFVRRAFCQLLYDLKLAGSEARRVLQGFCSFSFFISSITGAVKHRFYGRCQRAQSQLSCFLQGFL